MREGNYSLTPAGIEYFIGASPTYSGALFDLTIDNYSIYSIESLKRAVMTDGPQVYGGGVQMFKSHEEQHKLARKFTRSIHSASMAPATVTHPLEATAVELFTMAYNRESNGFHLMRLGG